ncbi:MAG TPA: hypothetical protein VK997_00610 [Deferrisomatales bacterium]|nr:hypothetical protein [Deferrisomatales bacterium]
MPPPSRVLCLYYGFLLLTTALSHGLPYPLFGVMLTGHAATGALALDCLLLIHIVVGVARAQRLTWYLLLGYNAVNLLSLLVTLAVLTPGELDPLLGDTVPSPSFYTGVGLAVVAMLVATAYAVRARHRFHNTSPYLL